MVLPSLLRRCRGDRGDDVTEHVVARRHHALGGDFLHRNRRAERSHPPRRRKLAVQR